MAIRRRVLINVILGVVIVALIVGGVLVLVNPFAASNASSTTQLTSTVQQGTVSSTITATGSIAPVHEVNASFGVSGTIATVNTSLGATVTAGQVLGTLTTTTLQQAVNTAAAGVTNAKASLANANQAYADAQSSPGGNATSAKSQVLSAQSNLTNAQNTLATAEANLADATLTSPINGLVVALSGVVGGSASGGGSTAASTGSSGGASSTTSASSSSSSSSSGFATIADISSETVTANIAEADIAKVTVGQAATVTFPAAPTLKATAKVTAIAPTGTTSNSVVTYATTITLDSIPAGLRLGQTADVAITTAASAADALYVPTAAITTANGVSTVKVVANGKTTVTTVTLGVVGDSGTEIKSGLKAGQTIVIGTVSPTTTTGTTGTGTGGRFGGAGGFGGAGTGGFGGRTGGTGGTGGTGAGPGAGQ